MKVSICIPAYENADGIKRLLDSVRVQKYSDYEVIITDDSKTEQVKELAQTYIDSGDDFSSKITYCKNETRLGAGNNWNHAIDLSKGDYIKIMHHDDWFSTEDSLGGFVRMLDENPQAVLAFSGTYQVTLETNESFARFISENDLEELEKDYRYLYLEQVIGAPSATIYRRTNLRFAPELSWLIDAEFYMKVFKKASEEKGGYSKELFAYSLEPLISIGVSANQLTEQVRDDVKVNQFEYQFVMKEFGLDSEERFKARMKEVNLRASRRYIFVAPARMIKEKIVNNDIKYIGKMCFYLGLFIGLVSLGVIFSQYSGPIQFILLGMTLLLFVLKLLCTKCLFKDMDLKRVLKFALISIFIGAVVFVVLTV